MKKIILSFCILLSGYLNVAAYEVAIGSNIDSTRDYGPVSVDNGESVIFTQNGVTIYNNFEVKLGASLEILHF